MEPLSAPAGEGRAYTGTRKVRLGDVSPRGRLRLDALTRYTQDVSNDDTTDGALDPSPGWVVRSTVVDEIRPAKLGETLTFTTFCAGLGKRWAERRLTVAGDGGPAAGGGYPIASGGASSAKDGAPYSARYEVSTLWVCVDEASGRPNPLTEQFLNLYASAAAGRKASARQENPKLRAVPDADQVVTTWQLRKVDFDPNGHVNNAAYWATVEEWLASGAEVPRRARIEYAAGINRAPSVEVVTANLGPGRAEGGRAAGDGFAMWWLQGGTPAASASIRALAPGTYR